MYASSRRGSETLEVLDSLVCPKHIPAFSKYLGCIFFSQPLQLKLRTPGHRFLSQRLGLRVDLADISWEDGPPRMEFLQHLWETPHSHHCFTASVLLRAWNWWIMTREYCFASTKKKITPFHPSLEESSGKQPIKRKLLSQPIVHEQMELFNDQNSTNRTGNRHHLCQLLAH